MNLMKLSRLAIISLVVAMLAVATTQLINGDLFRRGPVAALAEGEDEIWWSDPQPIADDPVIYDPEPVADGGGDQVAWTDPQPIADDQPPVADSGGDSVAWSDPRPIVDGGGYGSPPVSYGQGTYGQGTVPAPRSQPQVVYQPYPVYQPVYQPPQTVYVDRQPITQEVRQEVNVDNRTEVDVDVDVSREERERRRRREVREIIREVPVIREVPITREVIRDVTREVTREVPVTRFATVDRPVYVPVSQPYVVEQPRIVRTAGAQVQELPKTGLPFAGLALAGLLPVGWRLRRFGQAPQRFSANSVWENRQFSLDR